MQIKIEVEVRPEELRRFIGLPDVAGLQDDVIQFMRDKLLQAGENFDASAFVKSNLKLLSRSPILGRLFTAAGMKGDEDEVATTAAPPEEDFAESLAVVGVGTPVAAAAPARARKKTSAARKNRKPRTSARKSTGGKRARRPAVHP